MNHFSFKLLLIIFVSFSIISCKKKGDTPAPSSNGNNNNNNVNVSFLKEGATTTYYYQDFFNKDTVVSKVEKQIGKDTFLIRITTDIPYYPPTQYWVINNGVLSASYRLRDPQSYEVLCNFGAPAGTKWTANSGYQYTIEAINVEKTTAYGVIKDVVRMEVKDLSGDVYYSYYSPTIGYVGVGGSSSLDLLNFVPGNSLASAGTIPKISFGNFSFMKVGKFWRYSLYAFEEDTLLVEVMSKLSNSNIYKIKMTAESTNDVSYEYWFEDNGYLMAYNDGETIIQADPIYMSPSVAKVGYGWVGKLESGGSYIYKITAINESKDTYFGSLPCMSIDVATGLFSSQTNFWNESKGEVLVEGFLEQDIVSSNAKKTSTKIPFVPGIVF